MPRSISPLLNSTLPLLPLVAQLIHSYVTSASAAQVADLGLSLVDHSLHLCSTRPGATSVAWLAAYSTAKDRKRIMKTLKGYARSTLLHPDAYVAIIRLIQVTDDTVTVQKMLLSEVRR